MISWEQAERNYYEPPEPPDCCICNSYAEHELSGEFYCDKHYKEYTEDEEE